MRYYDIKEIHCNVDTFLLNITNSLLPHFYKYSNESNIYCISLLFSFLSSYTLFKKIKILPGLFFFTSYFFNILYHNYIQKYKKQTHIHNNFLILISYIYILILLYNRTDYAFIIIFFLLIPTICNWGCQIKYIKKNYPGTHDVPIFNDMCKILCPFFENNHKIYNIFGNGSLMLIVSIILAYL